VFFCTFSLPPNKRFSFTCVSSIPPYRASGIKTVTKDVYGPLWALMDFSKWAGDRGFLVLGEDYFSFA